MNFLLHMLGRTQDSTMALRPSPRALLLARAAREAANGNVAHSLKLYQQIQDHGSATPIDSFILGHLALHQGDAHTAARTFSSGIERLLAEKTPERLLAAVQKNLNSSYFHRAIAINNQARGIVETLLAATAGLLLAADLAQAPSPTLAANPLLPLSRFNDLLLQTLARTHLASNLASGLRQRQMRSDLAPWATTATSVTSLLEAECEHLQKVTAQHPHHPEIHLRLALVGRALGGHAHLACAIAALTRVLSLHPRHCVSAALLVATQQELTGKIPALAPLTNAFDLSPNEFADYYAVAQAAAEPARFDRTAEALHERIAGKPIPEIKANLAFALSQLSRLDPAHILWREPATV